MKNKLIGLVLLCFAVLAVGCNVYVSRGSGRVISESRPVSNFDQVLLNGTGELVITQGETEALTVEAEDNIMPHITTTVIGGQLRIGFDREQMILPTRTIRFNLTVKDLRSLGLAGAANITLANLKTDRLAVQISGTGQVHLDQLQATDLSTTLSGAGQVEVTGQVTGQTIEMNGTGQYSGADLKSDTASIRVSGAGGVSVWAATSLNVSISGAGSVSYYGNPRVTQHISGVGNVSRRGYN